MTKQKDKYIVNDSFSIVKIVSIIEENTVISIKQINIFKIKYLQISRKQH